MEKQSHSVFCCFLIFIVYVPRLNVAPLKSTALFFLLSTQVAHCNGHTRGPQMAPRSPPPSQGEAGERAGTAARRSAAPASAQVRPCRAGNPTWTENGVPVCSGGTWSSWSHAILPCHSSELGGVPLTIRGTGDRHHSSSQRSVSVARTEHPLERSSTEPASELGERFEDSLDLSRAR